MPVSAAVTADDVTMPSSTSNSRAAKTAGSSTTISPESAPKSPSHASSSPPGMPTRPTPWSASTFATAAPMPSAPPADAEHRTTCSL